MYQAPASTSRTRSGAGMASTTQQNPEVVTNQPDPELDPVPQQNFENDLTQEEGDVVDRPLVYPTRCLLCLVVEIFG